MGVTGLEPVTPSLSSWCKSGTTGHVGVGLPRREWDLPREIYLVMPPLTASRLRGGCAAAAGYTAGALASAGRWTRRAPPVE